MSSVPILEVKNLSKSFLARKSLFASNRYVYAVNEVSFTLQKGQTLGLVGESGCGKSTLARVLLRLLSSDSGTIEFQGQDLIQKNTRELRQLRRSMQMIFQDPFSSLNPRMKVEAILEEPFKIHGMHRSKTDRAKAIEHLLEVVGLPNDAKFKFPHEFSGGQRQRIGIARALALNPDLIIADEPVSALDVSIQSQVLNLLKDIRAKFQLSMIFISHDLAVIEFICDVVAVMYLGRIVEIAKVDDLFRQPLHPYTKALLAAVPGYEHKDSSSQNGIDGDIPSPLNPPSGCEFHPRCPYATALCKEQKPVLKVYANGREVRCHYAEPAP